MSDQKVTEHTVKYLKLLNRAGETEGDFKNIFSFINEKGYEVGDVVGQGLPIKKGIVKLGGREVNLELFAGFALNDLPSKGSLYTSFDLNNIILNYSKSSSSNRNFGNKPPFDFAILNESIGHEVFRIRAYGKSRAYLFRQLFSHISSTSGKVRVKYVPKY